MKILMSKFLKELAKEAAKAGAISFAAHAGEAIVGILYERFFEKKQPPEKPDDGEEKKKKAEEKKKEEKEE